MRWPMTLHPPRCPRTCQFLQAHLWPRSPTPLEAFLDHQQCALRYGVASCKPVLSLHGSILQMGKPRLRETSLV